MSDDKNRDNFEAWISAPPYGKPIARYSTDPKLTSWPGHYRFYGAQLAWEAWQARDAEIEGLKRDYTYETNRLNALWDGEKLLRERDQKEINKLRTRIAELEKRS